MNLMYNYLSFSYDETVSIKYLHSYFHSDYYHPFFSTTLSTGRFIKFDVNADKDIDSSHRIILKI